MDSSQPCWRESRRRQKVPKSVVSSEHRGLGPLNPRFKEHSPSEAFLSSTFGPGSLSAIRALPEEAKAAKVFDADRGRKPWRSIGACDPPTRSAQKRAGLGEKAPAVVKRIGVFPRLAHFFRAASHRALQRYVICPTIAEGDDGGAAHAGSANLRNDPPRTPTR